MLIDDSLIKLSWTAATSLAFPEEIRLDLHNFWRVPWLSRVLRGRLIHDIGASGGQDGAVHVNPWEATVSHVRPFLLIEK